MQIAQVDPTAERGTYGPRGFVEVELRCGDVRVAFQPQTIGATASTIEQIEELLAAKGERMSDTMRQDYTLLLETLRLHFADRVDPE